MRNLNRYILLLFTATILIGCNLDHKEDSNDSKVGELRLTMGDIEAIETNEANSNKSKATSNEVKLNDFLIDVTKLEVEPTTIHSSTYEDMPVSITLSEGDYRVSAQLGEMVDFTTKAPTYYTHQDILIKIGQLTTLQLTAQMWSYTIEVNYTDEFKKAFKDYYIELHNGVERYSFAHNNSENAYLAPGSVDVVLKGTTSDDEPYSTIIKKIESQGKQHYILTLTITNSQSSTTKELAKVNKNNIILVDERIIEQ